MQIVVSQIYSGTIWLSHSLTQQSKWFDRKISSLVRNISSPVHDRLAIYILSTFSECFCFTGYSCEPDTWEG